MSLQMKHLCRNEAGFSLMAVMAIATVVGLLAVLMISVVTHMFRGGHRDVQVTVTGIAINTAAALIGNATYCDNAFKIKSGALDPVTPPTGTTAMYFNKPGAGGNANENATFDVIEFNTTPSDHNPILWRGMSLKDYGAPEVTIDHMNISTTAGGVDLAGPSPVFTYTAPNGTQQLVDPWPVYVNIWFTSPDHALHSRSFPVTLLTPHGDAIGTNTTIQICSTADGAAQICWELGGSLDPSQNYRCTHTSFQRLTGYGTGTITCNNTSAGIVDYGCASAGVPPPASHGNLDVNQNPMPAGYAPIYSFIGINGSGAPICACMPFYY